MSKTTRKWFAAALVCVLLCAALVLPAYGNSAESYWEGVSASGVLITDGECPLVVEHETLTFDIGEFPSSHYGSVEDFLSYNASVTAEYTFYNPSDLTVTANLLFPFGVEPYYGQFFDYGSLEYLETDTTDKYGAQVNGADVQTTVRHSYWNGALYSFDPAKEMAKLQDDYRTDSFLTYELPVYVYTYAISGADIATYYAARAAIYFESLSKDSAVMLENSAGGQTDDDGGFWISAYGIDQEIKLYIFGEDIGEVEWTFFEDGALDDEIEGRAELIDRQQTTFGALAMQAYDADSGIAAHDWFNAIISQMQESSRIADNVYGGLYNRWDVSQDLLQWYEYEITLAPGERLTNTVTAPVYPNIDEGYSPSVYYYSYFLTPASLWREFGTLDIYINTPYYMVKESKGEFSIAPDEWTRTDAGYEIHLEGLPDEDLQFSLSEVQDPGKNYSPFEGVAIALMIAAAIYAMFLLMGVCILIVTLFGLGSAVWHCLLYFATAVALLIAWHKRKRNREAQEAQPPHDDDSTEK